MEKGNSLLRNCKFNIQKPRGFYYLFSNFVGNMFFVYSVVIALILIFFSFVSLECVVIGTSMQPTYNSDTKNPEDVVYVNTLNKDFQFGDIIVIDVNENDPIIKRVIGLPGDVVDVVFDENLGYKLEINGKIIEEDYLKIDSDLDLFQQNGLAFTSRRLHVDLKDAYPELYSNGKLIVPEGEIFALGDNRHDSKDSTYYGTFSFDQILGIVELERFHGESEFWFYWDYVVQGKFFYTIKNCF